MNRPARLSIPFASLLLAGALAAVAPSARWCPIPWERIDPVVYLTCDAGFDPPPVACPAREDAAATSTLPRCAGERCERSASCPMRNGIDPGRRCATDDVNAPGAPGAPAAPGTRGRAYCLGAPGMSAATRSAPPEAPVLLAAIAIHALVAQLPPPAPASARAPDAVARPPTSPAVVRPPVRGPPDLLA